MHQVIGTDTNRRLELRARVASSVLFATAVVGLFLPWADRPGQGLVSLAVLMALPGAGLALGIRGTRKAAVARAILAAVGTAPFVLGIGFSLALSGRPPDWMGAWVTFWALVGAFVANVIAHRARRARGGTATG